MITELSANEIISYYLSAATKPVNYRHQQTDADSKPLSDSLINQYITYYLALNAYIFDCIAP